MEQPDQLLAQRGILDTAKAAGWSENGTGWKYPTYRSDGKPLVTLDGQPILRWKAYDSTNKPKYLWMPSQLGDSKPRYYMLPGTKEAIVASEGLLYLASGEPDNLVFRTTGANNVMSWFGETQTPDTLAADLTLLGVQKIECWPDLDKTGQDWAKAIHDQLANTLIKFTAYRLPGEMDSAQDINKIWMACTFDKDRFWGLLALCPEIKFPSIPTLLDQPKQDYDELPAAYYEAIERRLGVTAYKDNGYSKDIVCPMQQHEHDAKTPSAGWHHDKKHLKCFKCKPGDGQIYLSKEVAAKLGIDWRDYLPKPMTKPAIAVPKLKIQVVRSWDSASDNVANYVDGIIDGSIRAPLPMPFKQIRQFGGFAKAIPAGFVVGVAADSGHGKTSFVETLIDYWRRRGFSGIGWSPEWKAEEHVYRAVQRAGGPSMMEMIDHIGWCAEAQQGIPESKRAGKGFDKDQVATYKEKLAFTRSWTGKYSLVDQMGLTVEEIIDFMRDDVDMRLNAGENIVFTIADYAQLFNTSGEKAADRIERATAKYKAFCRDYDLTGVITAQVTKEAGREAAKGEPLGQHSLQNMRGDYLNLLITLSRAIGEGTGQKLTTAVGSVSKNSLGRDGDFSLVFNEKLLKWADPEVELVA